ncbi:hypothetical protein ATI02_2571 [Pseudomonas baetica]|uniref:Uncharacterized protein n=1 Tax=Pseudomonas baetica TaxID=674054 RepID=A0ABX4PY93_9PSED|nr:hypothetical protein ATI02_2571 [Pseudomonas baetica]
MQPDQIVPHMVELEFLDGRIQEHRRFNNRSRLALTFKQRKLQNNYPRSDRQ